MSYYAYLVSSLPMLFFGMKPPLGFDKFLKSCEGVLSEEDINILRTSTLDPNAGETTEHPTLNKWRTFDRVLRNELVKVRSPRKKTDPLQYLKQDGQDYSIALSHTAMAALRAHPLTESEKVLDKARWNFLDELEIGHYFDMDLLIIYAHKLLILEKWEKINSADSPALAEGALKAV